MKRNSLYLFLLVGILFSCKEDRMKGLAGTWRAIKFENHEMDSIFTSGQAFIDTMGKNNPDSTNLRIYGVANIDSLRKLMQQQHDEALADQDSAVKNTVFTFRKDGVAVISFGGRIDSNKWTLDNENNLIIESLNPADKGEVLKWKIAELSKDHLKLVFRENNDSTVVTFRQ